MTSIESRSYCRVVVVAPSTRVDLALPSDVPVIDLLPMLLQVTGEAREDGGGAHGGWKLVRAGHGELDGGRTLRALDVADGELLRLAPREEPTVVPIYDDVVDAIASTRRERINARSMNPGLAAGLIVAAMAAAALTLFLRGLREAGTTTVDAYVAGGLSLVLLGLAAAIAHGYRSRILATATAAAGIPTAFVCGLGAVGDPAGHWGVLLGAALCLAYTLGAALALRTGTVVFAAVALAAVFTGVSALIAGAAHVDAVRVVAGTAAVALGALSLLPRLAVRLARLPLATVPTSAEDLQAGDEPDNIADVTARARVAGEYLAGTQIGTAAVAGFCAFILGAHLGVLSVALAATVVVALALRARSIPGLGARVALVGSAALGGLAAAVEVARSGHDGNGIALLLVLLGLALVTLVIASAPSRHRVSPQLMRLIDYFESAVVIAVLPLAVGAMGLYSVLRHL